MNILIVDDEPMTLVFMRRAVEGPNRTIFTAPSFEESQRIAHQNQIDLLITDLQMPGYNGFAVANMVRGLYPTAPVFLVTGSDADEDVRFASMAGFTKMFTKPLQLVRLKEAITAVERGQLKSASIPTMIAS